jgi:hypothetical protein
MARKLVSKVFDQYVGIAMSIFSRWPIGTNVFEREWDVLVLLDTCRVDALREVAPEYDFLGDVESIISVGSTSREWMACTFVEEHADELGETIYVSANAFDEQILRESKPPEHRHGFSWSDWKTVSDDDLLSLDQVWKYAPQPPHGHVRPRHVTDRAIANAREHDPERMIVHYSQPHAPYTADADAEGRDELYEYEKEPAEYLKNGGEFRTVWSAYLSNLRMVLDDVELLLENVDADVVAISADHGEAFGEWGVTEHPIAVLHPNVKRVPWTTTTAANEGTYTPSLEPGTQTKQVEEHLRDMGYL